MAILRQKDFQTNVAREIRFLDLAGESTEGQFGPQVVFKTDQGQFYVNPDVAEVLRRGLADSKAQAGEPVDVVKAEVDIGRGRKSIRWQVSRVGAPPAQPQPAKTGLAGVPGSGAYGQQKDSTFVVPALPGRVWEHPPLCRHARRKRLAQSCPTAMVAAITRTATAASRASSPRRRISAGCSTSSRIPTR